MALLTNKLFARLLLLLMFVAASEAWAQLAVSSFTFTNVSCAGSGDGAASIQVTGGTGTYFFTWKAGTAPGDPTIQTDSSSSGFSSISGLSGGSYQVIVFNSSVTPNNVTQNFVIQESVAALTIQTLTVTDVTCKFDMDGIVQVRAQNGAPGDYTYILTYPDLSTQVLTLPSNVDAVFQNLDRGNYTLTIQDQFGCEITQPITVNEPDLIAVSILSTTNVGCKGSATGTANISVTGGNGGYTYQWFLLPNTTTAYSTAEDPTNLVAGNYQVRVTDFKGCTDFTTNITITEPATNVSASLLAGSVVNVSCNGDADGGFTIRAANGVGPYTIAINGGGAVAFNSGNDHVVSGVSAGVYSIEVFDFNGCPVPIFNVTVAEPAALTITLSSTTDLSCRNGTDGAIDVTYAGGTLFPFASPNFPYIINWTNTSGNASFIVTPTGDLSNITFTGTGNIATFSVTVTDANGCSATLGGLSVDRPANQLAFGTTPTVAVSCPGGNDGQVTINHSVGGGAPYIYSIFPAGDAYDLGSALQSQATNVITGLAAGQYDIYVEDVRGCVISRTITINQPNAIVITPDQLVSPTACGASNGTIRVAVTGGAAGNPRRIIFENLTTNTVLQDRTTNVAPDFFSLNQIRTLAGIANAGQYRVTYFDANNCQQSALITLSDPSGPTVNVSSVVNVICNGASTGSIDISVSGGSGTYAYNWSGIDTTDGANTAIVLTVAQQTAQDPTALPAGMYTVQVIDINTGCQTFVDSIGVVQPLPYNAQFVIDSVTCNGSSDGGLSVTITGNNGGYTYYWPATGSTSNSISGVAGGTYVVEVTDALGCFASFSETIYEPAVLVANVTSSLDADCFGVANGEATVTHTGGNDYAAFTYLWSTIPAQTTPVATGLVGSDTGTLYFVQVTDAVGCFDAASIRIYEPAQLTATVTPVDVINCAGLPDGELEITAASGGLVAGQYQYRWIALDAQGDRIDSVGFTASLPTGDLTFSGLFAGDYIVEMLDPNSVANCVVVLGTFTIGEPNVLSADVTAFNEMPCSYSNNGRIEIRNAQQGPTPNNFEFRYIRTTAPVFTSAWEASNVSGSAHDFLNLISGDYVVEMRDANTTTCEVTLGTFTINAPDSLEATVVANDVTGCFGNANGSLVFTNMSGGNVAGQYEFRYTETLSNMVSAWTPNGNPITFQFLNLPAGSYDVEMRDATAPSCVVDLGTYVIDQPDVLDATLVLQDIEFCFGNNNGTITFTNPTGGSGNYLYQIVGPINNPNIQQTAGYQASNQFALLFAGEYEVYIADANFPSCIVQFANVTLAQPDSLSALVSYTDVTGCFQANNGTITVSNPINSPNPSNAIYQVSLNSGASWTTIPSPANTLTFTGLAAGNYTVLLRDSINEISCTRNIAELEITQPAQLNATVTPVDVTVCFGNNNGELRISGATGGIVGATYEYSIDNGASWLPAGGTAANYAFTNLVAGSYTVIMRDAANPTCTRSLGSFALSQPNPISATVASTNVTTCFGGNNGSITVSNPFGGSGLYRYSIDNGATWMPAAGTSGLFIFSDLIAGTYSVRVQDFNNQTCEREIVSSLTISQPVPMTGTVVSTDETPCYESNNGTISITSPAGGFGGSPFQFSIDGGGTWMPASGTNTGYTFMNLSAGSYAVQIREVNNPSCTRVLSTAVISEPGQLNALFSGTNETPCFESDNGTITVGSPSGGLAGTSYQYSIDGSTWMPAAGTQGSFTFTNVVAGSYTVSIRDFAAPSCVRVLGVQSIAEPAQLSGVLSSTDETPCVDSNNGTITISNPQGGVAGALYQFSVDGSTWMPAVGTNANYTFTGLTAGTYNVTMRDFDFPVCTMALGSRTIAEPAALNAVVSSVDVSECFGNGNGSITFANPVGGIAGATYQFSIDGGITWRPLSSTSTNYTFTGLFAGTYNLAMRDFANPSCNITLGSVTLLEPAILSATVSSTNEGPCFESDNGTITLSNPSGGIVGTTYQYSINGGVSWMPATGTAGSFTFSNLPAGTYSVLVRDFDFPTCVESLQTVTITQPDELMANVNKTDVTFCFGNNNGEISITGATGGSGTFEYSINGGSSWSASGLFENLFAGSYNVQIRDAANLSCVKVLNPALVLTQPDSITANIAVVNVTGCFGNANGSITFSNPSGAPAPGNGTYEFSINGGGTWQTSGVFTNLPAGNYNLTIRYTDINVACTRVILPNFPLTQPAQLNATVSATNVAPCFGQANGSISITSPVGGSGTYEYSINGGANWFASGNFTALNPGVYNVVIRDAANPTCTRTLNNSLVITQPDQLVGSVASTNVTGCFQANNGSINISAVGGGSGLYQYTIDGGSNWLPPNGTANNFFVFDNLSAGIYNVQVRDAANTSCVRTLVGSLTISQPGQLNAVITAVPISFCSFLQNGSITIQGATGGSGSYEYSINGGASWQSNNLFDNLQAGTYNVQIRDAANPSCLVVLNSSFVLAAPQPISVSAIITNVTGCSYNGDGRIQVVAVGGTGTLTYSLDSVDFFISPIFDNLTAGQYVVYVRDANGCIATDTVVVGSPAPLQITLLPLDPACNGDLNGQIEVLATGGTGNLEYSIDGVTFQSGTRFADLAPGTYTVYVVDENGCIDSASVTLVDPAALVINNVFVTDLLCGGSFTGEVEVEALGGTGSLTYILVGPAIGDTVTQISNLFVGLAAGDYEVWVLDSRGCVDMMMITLNENPALVLDLVGVNSNICNDTTLTSAKANVSGGVPPYTYRWSTGDTTDMIDSLVAGVYYVEITDANGCTVSDTVEIVVPTELVTSVSFINACGPGARGTATVFVTGGVAPYTYFWSTGDQSATVDTLLPGSYTVTVTDANGCIGLNSVTIFGSPTNIEISLSSTSILCSGAATGTATVEITGGVAPYAALWNNGEVDTVITGLRAGWYVVTVTDVNGCEVTDSVFVSENPAIVLDFVVSGSPICQGATGASINMTIQGGVGPYSFVWTKDGDASFNETSRNIGNLSAGSYIVQVTDAVGCVVTDTVKIESLTQQIPSIVADGPTTFCDGGSVLLDARNLSGANFTNYRWFRNGSFLGVTTQTLTTAQGGTYFVRVFNGCADVDSDPIIVTVNPVPGNLAIVQLTGSDTLEATSLAGVTYQWLLNDQPIAGATNRKYKPTQTGNYRVRATNQAGCSTTSAAFTVTTLGVADAFTGAEGYLKLYPNPAQSFVNLQGNWTAGERLNIRLYDSKGALVLVLDQAVTEAEMELPLSVQELAKGLYTVDIRAEGNRQWSSRFIKH